METEISSGFTNILKIHKVSLNSNNVIIIKNRLL